MSACTNAPSMLHVETYLFTFLLTTKDSNMYSYVVLENIFSSFIFHTLCFLPLANLWPLIFTYCFYLWNMRYSRAFFLYSLVSMFEFSGFSNSHMCSFSISCSSASAPAFPNIFSLYLSFI